VSLPGIATNRLHSSAVAPIIRLQSVLARPVWSSYSEGRIYQNLEQYFGPCENCGDCCAIPGIFLPHEIDLLGNHLQLDRENLFRTYLIAELFTPHAESVPAFVISPVKTISHGGRDEMFLSDGRYARVRDAACIFRNSAARSCGIHEHKPFGCTLLICGRMTKARPLMLNKTYYYHRWLDSQAILFSIFPGLAPLYQRLIETVSPLPMPGKNRIAALAKGNAIIGIEMSEMMNGRRSRQPPFYRGPELT
jgi:Fe-S-cluster containining protein